MKMKLLLVLCACTVTLHATPFYPRYGFDPCPSGYYRGQYVDGGFFGGNIFNNGVGFQGGPDFPGRFFAGPSLFHAGNVQNVYPSPWHQPYYYTQQWENTGPQGIGNGNWQYQTIDNFPGLEQMAWSQPIVEGHMNAGENNGQVFNNKVNRIEPRHSMIFHTGLENIISNRDAEPNKRFILRSIMK